MKLLKEFTAMLCGSFDNSVQLERFAAQGITGYPEARHVNTRINDHIDHLPEDFAGEFVLEESYYTVGGAHQRHAASVPVHRGGGLRQADLL